MTDHLSRPCTAFDGTRLLISGPLVEVALAVKNASEEKDASAPPLVFDDATGRVVDFDLRGTKTDIIARLLQLSKEDSGSQNAGQAPQDFEDGPPAAPVPRGRGRPKLGVVAREVTLLPRHWEWLAAQSGGASVALRRLIDEARKTGGSERRTRAAREAAYHFALAMAGNMPGFEEAMRALFAGNQSAFVERISEWPTDVRQYAIKLAYGEATQLVP
ncbi:hypothetical protein EV217_4306 [Phyllobacterium myrsinacearum]|uniref:DUF2239 family protein n=1 Tax=Phyllobacterium myrsinacearum TaxID=28101 RepID=UPI00102977D3|nr:DUF2239 family protein [Phyllobacterium myrsinacearum]RZS77640.1 hypothetical protein EV217_4306 [Phyllobacterium myrsinacearum]